MDENFLYSQMKQNYRRPTIFHCHLIFVGRGKNENKKDENIQHNTKQWYRNALSGPKLENKKNGEQLKHRNIMNEILWIYGNDVHTKKFS